MGSCFSKKTTTTAIPPSPQNSDHHQPQHNTKNDQPVSKKELFVIKHRVSHEIDRHSDQETDQNPNPSSTTTTTTATTTTTGTGAGAIVLQSDRLSRSNSAGRAQNPSRRRRHSRSKQSFDSQVDTNDADAEDNDGEDVLDHQHRQRNRNRESEVRVSSSGRYSSKERRISISPSRGSSSKERRISISPSRRSESPFSNKNLNSAGAGGGNRPAKMVSVPATDKSNNAGGGEVAAAVVGGGVKRIQVKRNGGEAVGVAGCRTAASPRSRSPARANLKVLNENQNQNPQPVTLSRSNSRKAEQSPYRRNPLGEIDTNAAGSEQPGSKKQNCEKTINNKTNNAAKNSIAKEAQMTDEVKPAVENPKHNQLVSRTRSSRLSRDLDINPEALLSPNPNPTSYASLLLEDIQNFHQKNPINTTAAPAAAPPAFSLPACVSKACSIMEAVADLNSATSCNDRQFKKENLVESEKAVDNDLMEPSFHKYVTVQRGSDADADEQESSGSNSFAGSQQLSSWEPNSGDSTNCWSSNSRSNGRDNEVQGQTLDYPRNGIGRGRLGVHGRSAYSLPNNATTVAST